MASICLLRHAHQLASRIPPTPFHTTPSHYSASVSSPEASPTNIASRFVSKFKSRQPEQRTQLLDSNQLQLFSLTLHRPHLYSDTSVLNAPPKPGTPIPPYYHYAYFTAPFLERNLDPDGTDRSYNPDPPFTRRMWAGGSVHWPGAPKGNFLRVGEEVTERTKVLSCQPKNVKNTGEAMLVVGVEKEFENKTGVAVVDRRNWVFREALDPHNLPTPTPRKPPLPESDLVADDETRSVRKYLQTPVTMFRFSALTFNGHKIHYSLPWCQEVEGHRNLVVHGPMNLVNMLDFWRDRRGNQVGDYPDQIEYRATNPLYAEEPYRIVMDAEDGEKVTKCEVISDDGTTCMKGSIRAF